MQDWIECEVQGGIGYLTMARPQALNALSHSMLLTMRDTLRAWESDPAVHAVIIAGAGGKAFCAGGDIRFFHQMAASWDTVLEQYFVDEYSLDHAIHLYSKPVVALMDGVVMGGGMGVAQGAHLRLVTERTKMAMPETNIGLFPDVGGGWFLAQAPGHVGEYLGVTGAVIGAAEALYAGLADDYLPFAALQGVLAHLRDQTFTDGESVLAAFRDACAPHRADLSVMSNVLAARRTQIDRHFAAPDVPTILASLSQDECEWSRQTQSMIRTRSPLMMCVALEQVRRARAYSVTEELQAELGMMRHVFHGGDGVEGIRALAIDKDHRPAWQHAEVDAVSREEVARFFASPWSAATHPLRNLAPARGRHAA
ncbi:enoyl-CoA hydratase/isomerase family protein [Imbroritus primus]|uniref:enoyl-CoA hydratase/isomerase family protein n=1 Tax=Imbroritus primus TaxID=3058603 RepID=UPI003D1622BA